MVYYSNFFEKIIIMMNSSTLTLKTKETKVEPNLGSSKTITFPSG